VKLLLDENLSYRLLDRVAKRFPGSAHLRTVGLEGAGDETVWAYASEHGFALISKDSDFHQRAFLFGFPPKVIWVRRGNCSTREIASVILARSDDIERFGADPEATFLVIS
jgi:predicted nuclease of predicted toxin-antitoxin system